jgi:hypothetical protein
VEGQFEQPAGAIGYASGALVSDEHSSDSTAVHRDCE